jgi:hypothetical protein
LLREEDEPVGAGALAMVMVSATGVWWAMSGLLLSRSERAVRRLLWPFADWFDRRHGLRLSYFGLIIAAVSLGGLAAVF